MFPINIPALAPPAGPLARAHMMGFSAAPIVANITPISDEALAEAIKELDMRCADARSPPTDMAAQEVLDAEKRKDAIAFVVAGAAHQQFGLPQMIAAALAPALQNIENRLQSMSQNIDNRFQGIDNRLQVIETHGQDIDNRLQGIETHAQDIDNRLQGIERHARRVNRRLTNVDIQLNALRFDVNDARRQLPGIGRQLVDITERVENIEARVGRVENGVLGLRSSVRNQQIRAHNRRVHDRSMANGLRYGTRIQPLIKAEAQLGAGIPGFPPVQPPVVQVGDAFPSPPFPATLAEISNWTLPQIHAVAVMVNSDFGIVPGDTADECRVKLVRFLTDLV